ncbi:MAG: DNA recombination protein RmuC [Prevotella sp.]|nr:DNA recombination protein RmuC [Prevotella sp.]
MEIAISIAALIVGCIIGWLAQKSRQQALITKNEMLTKQADETKDEAQRQLAAVKEEAERRLESAKAEAQQNMNNAKAEAQQQLDIAKREASERLEATKAEAQQQLEATKKEASEQLARTKAEAQQQLEATKKEASEQLAKTKAEAQQQLETLKKEASEQLEATKKEASDLLAKTKAEAEAQQQKALAEKDAAWNDIMKGQEQRFNETMARMSEQMKNATADMLKDRQKEFADSSNQQLGQIVNPLRETIDKMKQTMADTTLKQTEMSSVLKDNIERSMQQAMAAKKSAEELANALKHGSKVQGDWGEAVLDELLTSQGLVRGIHYDTQAVIRDAQGNTVHTDDGATLRPDVILHLDQRREVIIDSKVSLTAFLDYANADNEADRQRFLKTHIDSLQKHVKELSTKDYSAYVQPPKVRMDYVIMFVPHTGALWTALNAQPDLWRKAMEQNVFIADEQTLFAALRIISLTWTQIRQAENHEQVYRLANEMLDRVGQFMKKYTAIGKALKTATTAYDDAERKLQPSGQSILQTCAKLQKLGAKQSDKNPLPQLIDIDEVAALAPPADDQDDN